MYFFKNHFNGIKHNTIDPGRVFILCNHNGQHSYTYSRTDRAMTSSMYRSYTAKARWVPRPKSSLKFPKYFKIHFKSSFHFFFSFFFFGKCNLFKGPGPVEIFKFGLPVNRFRNRAYQLHCRPAILSVSRTYTHHFLQYNTMITVCLTTFL